MASLIRQVSRLARQNVLINMVGARACSSSPPPSKAPSSVPNSTSPDNPLQSIEEEVSVNLAGFHKELKRRADPSAAADLDDVSLANSEIELGSVTGAHRAEILEQLRGTEDPFDMGVIKQGQYGAGDYGSPIVVPTVEGSRLVGCVCEEDTGEVVWMMIHSNEKKSCDCGNWFQGVSVPGARVH